MLTAADKFPIFDLSDIILETELSYKAFQPLKPIKTGGFIRNFMLSQDHARWQRFNNGGETHEPFMLKDLLNKPLVIGFYDAQWLNIGLKQLDQLNSIQPEIKANGGNLLIISADRDEELANIAWDHNLSLNFYFDDNNEIAKKFHVYSENDPAWSRFSGIDNNVPLLATYVMNVAGKVVYDHVELNFADTFSSQQVVSAVYDSALFQ